VKNTKLKKGEHCGQHSGDVAVFAWQEMTMISTYHKDDMRVVVNKQTGYNQSLWLFVIAN
jgi:hypothetical protein